MKLILRFCIISIVLFSCNDDSGKSNCPPYDIVPESPYNDPVWHPSGNIIGFNHKPIKEIHYPNGYDCPRQAVYEYDNDSAGFWLINSDGTNQRRILPYILTTPAWSPDGKWIAFSKGAQICIMSFDGTQFDTTTIVQLTTEGRNFLPAWSRNGDKIAFNESICDKTIKCGIWIFGFEARAQTNINIYGNYPSWHPSSDSLIYVTNAINEKGTDVGDSIWIYINPLKVKHLLKYVALPNYDNRNLRYSPTGTIIAFISSLSTGGGMQLYTINSDGSGLKQLTTDGCKNFSWSPEGKIVYLNFDNSRIDKTKGTLWIMNADGTNKRQLTYNNFQIIQ
ncbi:MAG: hypothetical protein Q8S54_14780 [Bacteroidota bacterium]|nr:hypothetical protein [Odoribacter sp.]MDP3644442.1 hypothetical protein [Bacteroidota bacterium]